MENNKKIDALSDFEIEGTTLVRYIGKNPNVVIPEGITAIESNGWDGPNTFEDCEFVTSIAFPSTLAEIDLGPFGGAFDGCRNLEKITVDSRNPVYCSQGNCLINKKSKTLVRGCKNSVIPKDVERIGVGAFSNVKDLTSIEIPDGVTVIEDKAFAFCGNLKSIRLPDSLTSIGDSAFCDCSALASINLPVGLTSIGDSAFCDCKALLSIDLPDSVIKVGAFAFNRTGITKIKISASVFKLDYGFIARCPDLKEIVIDEDNTSYFCKGNCIVEMDTKTLIIGFDNSVIPGGVEHIGEVAFLECTGLTDVVIPQGVTTIDSNAFYGCENLKSITLPEGITNIDDYAFVHCRKLQSIIYRGTKAQWNSVKRGIYWDSDTNDYTVYCTDGEIKKDKSDYADDDD